MSSAVEGMSIAEVRQTLLLVRRRWFHDTTPDYPFIISDTLETTSGPITLADFAHRFDYGQHLKRHDKSKGKGADR
jgi:hypothetical protein